MTKHVDPAIHEGDRPALTDIELLLLQAIAAEARLAHLEDGWCFESELRITRPQPCVAEAADALLCRGWIVVGEDGEIDLSHRGVALLETGNYLTRAQTTVPH